MKSTSKALNYDRRDKVIERAHFVHVPIPDVIIRVAKPRQEFLTTYIQTKNYDEGTNLTTDVPQPVQSNDIDKLAARKEYKVDWKNQVEQNCSRKI